MRDDNLIIQSLWIGKDLSPMELLCMQSYLNQGHEFHLYCYDEITNTPIGTQLKDANEIVPKEKIFLDSRGIIAAFSDYFRYCLLYKKGGWWVDMDTVCLNYFNIDKEYCFSTEGTKMDGNLIATAYIKSPPNAEYLKDCIDFIDEKIANPVTWGAFGPYLLTHILADYDCSNYIEKPEVFCPIHWYEIDRFIHTDIEINEYANSNAIHFWNERWRLEGLDKHGKFSPDCLYEKIKEKYGKLW